MVVLYPLVAAVFVVIAQYAYTQSQIAEHRGEKVEEKLWKNYRNFCYLFSAALVAAAFLGVFWPF